jgi:hypothetical protein
MMILWEHYCNKRRELIKTYLDKCPFCNVGKGLPLINPHLIDELHEKIKKQEANHD